MLICSIPSFAAPIAFTSWQRPDSHCLRQQFISDLLILHQIDITRYLCPRTRVPKPGNLHLAFSYALNLDDHDRFLNMLCVSPQVFHVLT